MKAKQRFIVAVIVLGLLMTGPFVVTSLLVWLDMRETERAMLTELLVSRLPVGTMMTLFGFVIGVLVCIVFSNITLKGCCAWGKPCA